MQKFGLSTHAALASRDMHGTNAITIRTRHGFWHMVGEKLNDPMIRILMVALGLNMLFAALGYGHWYESVGISIAVLLAVFVSAYSEYKNEGAFRALQQSASHTRAKVYRDNTLIEIPIDDIVVGDAVLLQPGDKVPADGFLIDGTVSLSQAALNGEARDAIKQPAPRGWHMPKTIDFDNPHTVFRGSVVYSGSAIMTVTVVGDQSLYGQIAAELQIDTTPDTPLQVKLRHLATHISRFGYIGAATITLLILFQNIFIQNGFDLPQIIAYVTQWPVFLGDVINALILGVTIIVMAVPEGLPLMVAIVSSMNMYKMLSENVLVRTISGIETAGAMNFLFSDKTGTLTRGVLDVVSFLDGNGLTYNNADDIPPQLSKRIALGAYCNTAATLTDGVAVGGNATDRAVLNFAAKMGAPKNVKSLQQIEFSSTRKYAATQLKTPENITLVMGAPEKILDRCTSFYDAAGHIKPIQSPQKLMRAIKRLTDASMRLVAMADTPHPIRGDDIPAKNWRLVGIMAIRDDIRPDAPTAVAKMHHAGIHVVMITGDRIDTATAIARDIGLITSDHDRIVSSDQLTAMSDVQLRRLLPKLRVVARAMPTDKSRLVRVAQSMNLVVGMTGDGVNDSPALKAADIGFAMGSGCDVAKQAGDIIILDDNFSSIAQAVLYGRTIFFNIRKFIVFQLTINVAAVGISFLAPLMGLGSPLSVVQILWINLVMDTFAALAFGGDAPRATYMSRPPIARTSPLVSRPMWGQIITSGIAIIGIGMYILMGRYPHSLMAGQTLYTGFFAFFVLAAIFNAINARTDTLNITDGITKNKMFIIVMGSIAVVQMVLVYLGGNILRGYGLTGTQWLFILGCAAMVFVTDMIRKIFINIRCEKIS